MPRHLTSGLSEEDVRMLLAEVRREFLDDRLREARASLVALQQHPEQPVDTTPLRRFFHGIAGLLPMLGFRELGYIARMSEDVLQAMQAQPAPALVTILEKSFEEVRALIEEATKEEDIGSTSAAQQAPPPPPASAASEGPPLEALRGSGTLLVVDDDEASARLVESTLSGLGYRVVICTSPTEVPLLLEREQPDLTLLDVMMPGVDGFELCQQIRRQSYQSYMPILFLSTAGALEDQVKGLSVGGDDFLRKPFEPRELAARVRSHLKRVATLREMSLRDALTRAYNRWYFDERLRQEVLRSRRSGSSLSLAMLDLDFFKSINDQYGHLAGDAVLVQVVQILANEFRSTDVLARYGGEEFALILLDSRLEDAHGAVARACSRVAHTPLALEIPDRSPLNLTLTLSGGVAALRPGEEPEQLLGRADRALYAAKAAGRNRVVSDEEAGP